MAFYSHLIAISILRHKDGKKGEKKKTGRAVKESYWK